MKAESLKRIGDMADKADAIIMQVVDARMTGNDIDMEGVANVLSEIGHVLKDVYVGETGVDLWTDKHLPAGGNEYDLPMIRKLAEDEPKAAELLCELNERLRKDRYQSDLMSGNA